MTHSFPTRRSSDLILSRAPPAGPSASARRWRRCCATPRSIASSTLERLKRRRTGMGNGGARPEPSFTVGMDEEYLLVDREKRDLVVDPPDSLMTRCEQEPGQRASPVFLPPPIASGTSTLGRASGRERGGP